MFSLNFSGSEKEKGGIGNRGGVCQEKKINLPLTFF